jgi:flagellar basal-body rod protein FlgB
MIFDALYKQGNIMGAALRGTQARNDVIVNNITNNDVPGFKARTVDFEDALARAIDDYKRTGFLDVSKVEPNIRFVNEHYNFRIDKNNVDVEMEMVALYQNSIKFEAMISCVQRNSARLNLALTGR